jgi:formylglycine-generating enzyme required for sulfatase activity
MTLKEAYTIVQNYADINDLNFADAMESMYACYDDLDKEDRTAMSMVSRHHCFLSGATQQRNKSNDIS